MKRIKDLIVRNFTEGRPGPGGEQVKITCGVFHTESDSKTDTQMSVREWHNNPASKCSAHHLIGLDGSDILEVEEFNTAWHAANWIVNLASIGIEHEDNGMPNDPIRTNELYETSAQLVADIYKRYGVPIKLVEVDNDHNPVEPGWVRHRQVSKAPGGTACPDGLDCKRIIKRALEIIAEPGPEAIA